MKVFADTTQSLRVSPVNTRGRYSRWGWQQCQLILICLGTGAYLCKSALTEGTSLGHGLPQVQEGCLGCWEFKTVVKRPESPLLFVLLLKDCVEILYSISGQSTPPFPNT